MKRALRIAALGLVVFVLAVNVYRAATQSIAGDEAYAYNKFLAGPVSSIFNQYDAANHVLQTLLSYWCIQILGLSEFALRLPSLLGGLLYVAAAYRISRAVFGEGARMVLALAVLALNPYILDYFSAARGYGLALGLFLFALDSALRYFREDRRTGLYVAGVALGLAVCANLVFLFPAIALGALILFAAVRRGSAWVLIDRFAGPAIVPPVLLLSIPLCFATRDKFYFGSPSLKLLVQNAVDLSFFHDLPLGTPPLAGWREFVADLLVPALFAAVCIAFAWAARRIRDFVLFFSAGTMVLALAMLVLAHVLLGLPYPQARTAVYLYPLFAFALTALAGRLETGGMAGRAGAGVLAVLAAGAVLLFVRGFTISYYDEWLYDRSTKRIVKMIRAEHRGMGGREFTLGVSWPLEPSVTFYKRRYRMDWLRAVDRSGPDRDADFYILLRNDRGLAGKRGLRILYTDHLSGQTLAAKR